MTLLTTISPANDTTFVHNNPNSLAGCYAVTAIDSNANESVFSNMECVDNCPYYELPNVFTPNKDGKNDIFTPFLPYCFVDLIDIKIYNRWGELVFQTDDPNISWKGKKMQTDIDLSEGVYFYVCDVYETRITGVKKLNKPLTGFIHLLKP